MQEKPILFNPPAGRAFSMRFPARVVMKMLLCSLSCLILVLSGCRKSEETFTIELPPTEILSAKTNWAVISSSHLRLREKPLVDATAVTTLWRGSVLEVLSRSESKLVVEGQIDFWYQINYDGLQGWVFGAYLELFDTKDKAEKASRELKK